MASSYAFSKYTPQQGSLLKRLRPVTSQRTSVAIPCKVHAKQIWSASDSQSFITTTTFTRKIGNPLVGGSTNLNRRKHIVNCAAQSEPESAVISTIRRFIRPYVAFGLVPTMLSTSLLPVQTMADLTPTFFFGVLQAIIAMVHIFIYNVSVNQLFDIEIDKINKPYLPLASGKFSLKTGIAITVMMSATSILMGFLLQSPPLICAILSFFILGGAYSINLPFLRWKRNPIMVIICNAIWGVTMQIGLFLHSQVYVLKKPMFLSRSVIFATIFQVIIGVIGALLKDLPDLDGDKANGVDNMTVRFGKEKVFWGCTSILLASYGGAIVMGSLSPFVSSKLITVIGHSALALMVWLRAKQIDLSDDAATQSYYMFIWSLSGVEALLVPFIR